MGEVYVVTGGGSGIGRAVAETLPKEATVVITWQSCSARPTHSMPMATTWYLSRATFQIAPKFAPSPSARQN